MPSEPHPETTPDQDRTAGPGQGGDSHGPRRARTLGIGDAYELLLSAVEHHALPRLLAAHGGVGPSRGSGSAKPASRLRIEEQDVRALLACVATPDFHLAEAALAAVAARGFTRSELLVDLLTPAARCLHDRWRQDDETFAAVALAIGRLRRLLGSDALPASDVMSAPPGGVVLVSGRAGEPHPFEAAVVADFFRCAQWDTECLSPRTEEDLADRLKARAFDCLVLVLGPEGGSGDDDALIRRMRRISTNKAILILVNGPDAGSAGERFAEADAAVENAAGVASAARNLLVSRVA